MSGPQCLSGFISYPSTLDPWVSILNSNIVWKPSISLLWASGILTCKTLWKFSFKLLSSTNTQCQKVNISILKRIGRRKKKGKTGLSWDQNPEWQTPNSVSPCSPAGVGLTRAVSSDGPCLSGPCPLVIFSSDDLSIGLYPFSSCSVHQMLHIPRVLIILEPPLHFCLHSEKWVKRVLQICILKPCKLSFKEIGGFAQYLLSNDWRS